MKSQDILKNLAILIVLSFLLNSNAFAFGMEGGGEGMGPGFGTGGNFHFPLRPISPSIYPRDKSYDIQPEFEVTQVVANYSVQLRSTNQNNISCNDLTKKIKEQNIQGVTQNQIMTKINTGSVLSQSEIKTLKNIQNSTVDFQNILLEEVDISVNWAFFGRMEYINSLNKNGHASRFAKFTVSGPGLSWDASGGGERPDFFLVVIDRSVELQYKMSIFDFCYGESVVTMTSKENEDGSDGYVLKASWLTDLTLPDQFGSWKVESLFDYGIKKR